MPEQVYESPAAKQAAYRERKRARQAAAAPADTSVVDANRIVLRDPEGRIRAELGISKDGEPFMSLMDKNGRARASLVLRPSGGMLLFRNEHGHAAAVGGVPFQPCRGEDLDAASAAVESSSPAAGRGPITVAPAAPTFRGRVFDADRLRALAEARGWPALRLFPGTGKLTGGRDAWLRFLEEGSVYAHADALERLESMRPVTTAAPIGGHV